MKIEVFLIILLVSDLSGVEFNYPFYSFRKKSSWSRRFNKREKFCRVDNCHKKKPVDLLTIEEQKCVRMCLSPSCYKELYEWNELEEGEVDVRASSFKGCTIAEMRKEADRDL